MQPLDALGSSLDGVLIGSSDVQWVSTASLLISGVCFVALFICRQSCPSLINYWMCMKVNPANFSGLLPLFIAVVLLQ